MAGYVGLGLLNGAHAFLGGMVLGNALGDPSITDVRIWISHAIAELEAFVPEAIRRQLDDLLLRDMEDDLERIMSNLHQYAELLPENREANRFLLEDVSTSTARLVSRSLRFDQAYFVATTAIAYGLFLLYAQFSLDRDKGHIKSAKPMIENAVKQLCLSRNRLSKKMSPEGRFDVVCKSKTSRYPLKEIPAGPRDYLMTCFVSCFGTRDGHQITETFSKKGHSPRDHLQESLIRQIQGIMEPDIVQMEQQLQDFQRAANSSLFQIIACFGKMCEEIGESYTPPNDAELRLENRAVNIPNLVGMPGATVKMPKV